MTPSRHTFQLPLAPRIRKFFQSEEGPTSVEYAVLLATIVLVCISAIMLVGGGTFNYWDNNRTELDTAFSGS